ncbi:MAG: SAM-dependent methyltransferase [Dehalococcoidales bacterium]|nr:SAM-dependent methyltransferase [Dehalococcoidales bacterium]
MTGQGVKNKVSQTASYTCFCRACADAERDERFKGPDSIARVFIPFLPKLLFLQCRPLGNLVMKNFAPRGIYEYVLARTRLFDEVYGGAIDEVIPQIVILGAGFDTRAWRFARRNRGTRVFELDAPITQQMKRKLLEKKGVDTPGEVTFVPIDFEEDNIAGVLGGAGYRSNLGSLFLWEGVTMYLYERDVVGTLEFIRENSAAGSRVLFDYVLASVLRRENTLYGESSVRRMVSKGGEKWVFGIEEGTAEAFLVKNGFRLVGHYTPTELRQKFLTAGDGKAFGRINETHCIAHAAVPVRN